MRKYDLISALSEETARALQIPVQRPASHLRPKTGCDSLCVHRDME